MVSNVVGVHRATRSPSSDILRVGLLALGVVASAALVIDSYADARHHVGSTHFAIFWLGYLLGIGSLLVLGAGAKSNHVTVSCILALGVLTFLPKYLMSIHGPVYIDEYAQFRQVRSVLATGNIMPTNTYLPILKYFPGLALVTAGTHEVTRLSVWHAAQLVVFTAHCATLALIYCLARAIQIERRFAFVAAVVFALNSSFAYFDTQYAYESLGIALAMLAMLACLKARLAISPQKRTLWVAVGVFAALSCTITHHVSTVVMVLGVVAIAALVPAVDEPDGAAAGAARAGRVAGWAVAFTAVAASCIWFSTVARPTFGYLSPHLGGGFTQLFNIATGNSARTSTSGSGSAAVLAPTGERTLFANSQSPLYERAAAFASPIIAFVAVVLGIIKIRHAGRIALLTLSTFILFAALYFASLPFALTVAGSEAAHRSWSFTYIGVAVTCAFGAQRWWPQARSRIRTVVVVVAFALLAVVAVGNITAGEDVAFRFPGPTVFGSATRGQTPELLTLAHWLNSNLPAGSHVVTDRYTGEVVEGYTFLDVPGPLETDVYGIYRDGSAPSSSLRSALRSGDFEYFILDTRIETQLPSSAFFASYHNSASVSISALTAMRDNSFSTLIHSESWYRVYRLNP